MYAILFSFIFALRSLFLLLFLLSFAGHCLQADLIAHYDFSDGDLLDNEVGGANYHLEAMDAPSTPPALPPQTTRPGDLCTERGGPPTNNCKHDQHARAHRPTMGCARPLNLR